MASRHDAPTNSEGTPNTFPMHALSDDLLTHVLRFLLPSTGSVIASSTALKARSAYFGLRNRMSSSLGTGSAYRAPAAGGHASLKAWQDCLADVHPRFWPVRSRLQKHPPWRQSAKADGLYVGVPAVSAALACKKWRALLAQALDAKVVMCGVGEQPPESTQVLALSVSTRWCRNIDKEAELRLACLQDLPHLRALVFLCAPDPTEGVLSCAYDTLLPFPPAGLSRLQHLVYVNLKAEFGAVIPDQPTTALADRICAMTQLRTLSLPALDARRVAWSGNTTRQLIQHLPHLRSFDAPSLINAGFSSAGRTLRSMRVALHGKGADLDVSALARASALESLCLVRHEARGEVSGIHALPHLKELEFEGNALGQRARHLSALTALEALRVRTTFHSRHGEFDRLENARTDEKLVAALAALRRLPRLSLSVASTGNVETLAELSTLEDLELTMAFEGTRLLSQTLGPVNHERWFLTRCNVTNSHALSALTRLTSLKLEFCCLDKLGCAALGCLTDLRTLLLVRCALDDPNPLSALVNLRTLRFSRDARRFALLENRDAVRQLASLRLSSICPRLRVLETPTWPIARWGSTQRMMEVVRLRELEELTVGCAGLHNEDLARLRALTRLRVLRIGGCWDLTAAGLRHLSACTALQHLAIASFDVAANAQDVKILISRGYLYRSEHAARVRSDVCIMLSLCCCVQ